MIHYNESGDVITGKAGDIYASACLWIFHNPDPEVETLIDAILKSGASFDTHIICLKSLMDTWSVKTIGH